MTATGAESVRWDLSPLYTGPRDEALEADLSSAEREAEAFAARLRGKIGELDAAALAEAVVELEAIQERVEKAGTFAYLHFSTDTADPTRGALLQKMEERSTAIATTLLFFELEWAAVSDERVTELVTDPALRRWRHFLESARRFRPHLLSEPEEKIMAEKGVTGRSAWVRFFTQVTETIEVSLEGKAITLEEALALLHDGDRSRRLEAGTAITEALAPGLPVRTYVLNAILADQWVDDRLRHYESWVASRHLANEIDEATVETLIDAVTSRYDIPARWYAVKRRLLGLDELTEHDRYAPLIADTKVIAWDEAKATVLDAYRSFSSEMAEIASRFFDSYIDAAVSKGKQGGAFAHPAVPSAHPYVLLNYTARRRDVMTIAHELGHGVHQVLAGRQGLFNASTPITLAETASILGETITFGRLLADEIDATARLALLAARIEDIFASVFRQVAMNRFEDAVHNARREEGELAPERVGEEWLRTQRAMFGESVRLTEEYASWWSYIPHFIHTPGYVYAYAFGNLLALAIYARYEAEGDAFVPSYLKLLSAGGSESPTAIARHVGVDLTDPDFWTAGLQVIDKLMTETEQLAATLASR
jgi:oligoendopeptidase F